MTASDERWQTALRLLARCSLLVACAGCISEAPRPEQESRIHPDTAPATYRFAAIADADLAPDAPTRTAKLEEVVSDLSALPGLDFVILAGKMASRSEDAETVVRTLAIVPAKKYEVAGATYTAEPREGIRLIVGPEKGPPRADEVTVLASPTRVSILVRGRSVELALPSLGASGTYLLVAIDALSVTARELAPGNPAPVKERREPLRK